MYKVRFGCVGKKNFGTEEGEWKILLKNTIFIQSISQATAIISAFTASEKLKLNQSKKELNLLNRRSRIVRITVYYLFYESTLKRQRSGSLEVISINLADLYFFPIDLVLSSVLYVNAAAFSDNNP